LLQDLARGQVGVDHLDAGAVEHDLLDRAVAQVERAENAVAVFLLDHALGMAERERAGDLLAHRARMWLSGRSSRRRGAARRAPAAARRHDRREDR
jgi:hypothetical protein